MGKSARNYWSPDELIEDLLNWQRCSRKYRLEGVHSPFANKVRENAKASWSFLRLAWGVPSHQDIDEFVLDEIEGRGHKFVRADRNIEARY